jgi:hypothetical protein
MLRENNITMGCSYWDAWKDMLYGNEEGGESKKVVYLTLILTWSFALATSSDGFFLVNQNFVYGYKRVFAKREVAIGDSFLRRVGTSQLADNARLFGCQ